MSDKKEIQKSPKSYTERFTNKILSLYSEISNEIKMSDKEKSLIAGYYIECDKAIKTGHFSWNEIDMSALALDLANKARLGLDMQVKNHLFPIPFRNKKTGKVILNLIIGFEGEKHLRLKFAEEKPLNMRVELIHESDNFIPQKMGDGDSYVLEIPNPFNRGAIVGGIGYIQYEDSRKNVLIAMSEKDILKRKPSYAKPEFWEKWKEKMYAKTIMKELCNHIPLDSDKVREYRELLSQEENREIEIAKVQSENEIEENANSGEVIDVEYTEE